MSDWPNKVTKKDLRIEFYRGSGKGGQHRNKTDSACRITHIPTGISAQAEDDRSQHRNKRIAFRRLANKLVPLMKHALSEQKVERSNETIRTYHEIRGTVKDHRIKDKIWSYKEVLEKKGLSAIIKELLLKENKRDSIILGRERK